MATGGASRGGTGRRGGTPRQPFCLCGSVDLLQTKDGHGGAQQPLLACLAETCSTAFARLACLDRPIAMFLHANCCMSHTETHVRAYAGFRNRNLCLLHEGTSASGLQDRQRKTHAALQNKLTGLRLL